MHPQCSPFLLLLLTLIPTSTAGGSDTITPATPLTDGETIVSNGSTFELGFFSPKKSENRRYIGIWYHNIPVQTVVWVANPASPIPDKTGVLTISRNGTLILSSTSNTTFWSSLSTIDDSSNPFAQLLDSGNLVARAAGWQSFDHPTDTLLEGMKLGGSLKGGLNRYLTAWETMSDPYPGQYTFKMEPQGLPEFFLYSSSEDGEIWQERTGDWTRNNSFSFAILRSCWILHADQQCKERNYSALGSTIDQRLDSNRSSRKDLDLLLFNMVTIMAATENFILSNKLGEGGFGHVYKGKLGDGQEIAVKKARKDFNAGTR